MLERMWSKENTPPLLVEEQICTDTLEISMAVSQKIWNTSTSRHSNTTLGQIPKGFTLMPQGHLPNCVIAVLFVITRTWK